MSYAKPISLVFIISAVLAFAFVAYPADDPNAPSPPPKPNGTEHIRKFDDSTIWVTTTVAIKKKNLLRQKSRLVERRRVINEQIAILNTRLAAFE